MGDESRTKAELIREIEKLRHQVAHLEYVEKEKGALESMYYDLIQECRDGYAMLDKEGKFILCNPVYSEMTGYSLEALKNKTYEDVTDKKYYELDKLHLGQMLKRGFSDLYEKEYIKSDGTIISIEIRSYVIKDENGEFNGTWSYVRDITERKLAEEKIRKLNRLYIVLSNINQTIIREKDRNKLLQEVCRIAVEDGKFRMAWIGRVNNETNKVDVVSSAGHVGGYLDNLDIDLANGKQAGGPTGKAALSGEYVISSDVEHDDSMFPWQTDALKMGYRSAAAFPVKVFGKVWGAFNLYAGETHFFDQNEIKLLDELALDISFALEFTERETERKKIKEEMEAHRQHLEKMVAEKTKDLVESQEALISLLEDVNESKNELEKKNKELERMNKVMVDRELKMIEMKKEMKKLKGDG